MKISAGIESEMFDKAYGEIMLQLEKMQKGDFTDDEIVSAKKYIATGLSSTRDSLGATEQYYYTQLLLENDESISSLIENIDRVDSYMQCEKRGVFTILNNMQTLGVKGGAIIVKDEVVAFTLGSPINSNVFDIHVEKALKDYSEAYTVINNQFAKNELSDYKYINREDDMGLEGLRKAKLSYKPHILLKKYHCYKKHDTENKNG